jgi:hypothetical protein
MCNTGRTGIDDSMSIGQSAEKRKNFIGVFYGERELQTTGVRKQHDEITAL